MFTHEITLNQFLLDYFEGLIKDLPAESLAEQGGGVGHSALWILGHLAVTSDFGLAVLGGEMQCPKRWMVTFGPGSSDVVEEPAKYDPQEFVRIIRSGYPKVQELAVQADPGKMSQPHSSQLLKNTKIQTVGDIVAHLLTTHMATHLGQLSFWRRLHGKGPLF